MVLVMTTIYVYKSLTREWASPVQYDNMYKQLLFTPLEGFCTVATSISEQNRTQGKRIKIGWRGWSNKASASSIHGNYWSDRTQLRTTIQSESRMMSGWALARKHRTRVKRMNTFFSTCSLVFHSVSSPFRTGRTDRQTTHRTTYTLHRSKL